MVKFTWWCKFIWWWKFRWWKCHWWCKCIRRIKIWSGIECIWFSEYIWWSKFARLSERVWWWKAFWWTKWFWLCELKRSRKLFRSREFNWISKWSDLVNSAVKEKTFDGVNNDEKIVGGGSISPLQLPRSSSLIVFVYILVSTSA